MNLEQFYQHRETVSDDAMRMDLLSIVDSSISIADENLIDLEDYIIDDVPPWFHTYRGSGIRHLLDLISKHELSPDMTVAIPSDVFTEYATILQAHTLVTYDTYPSLSLPLNNDAIDVILIPNPLIPIGRYLSDEELEQLSVWCHAKTTRKIIFDTGYDFERKGNLDLFTDGAHVIELRSASKFTFKPKMAGWAVSNRELSIPTRSGALPQINNNAHALLQDKFNARFAKVMTVSDLITMPQVGYLALAPISYKELLDDHNVAGIPATLFGSKRKDMTILSAL